MEEQLQRLWTWHRQSTGASIDNRKIKPGQLFFGLPGAHSNGGKFAADALARGALCCVVDNTEFAVDERCIVVPDVLSAMHLLAARYRDTFDFPVLALTGSNGKTTTKELIAAVLSKRYKVYATEGNLNNHIGVPLTLLNVPFDCNFAVVEMGANHKGEIAGYCTYADPDFALITNIGKAHLEGFGGEEGVLAGKSELYAHVMRKEGVLFWNSAQEKLAPLVEAYPRTVRYGVKEGDYIIGKFSEQDGNAVVEIDEEVTIQSHLVGSYNAENMLAAACVGKYFDVGYTEIRDAISAYYPSNNRSEQRRVGDTVYVMDAYNANPSSMQAALENFSRRPENNKMVVLGDMMELGDAAEEEHRNILTLALKGNFSNVVLVGPMFSALATSPLKAFQSSEDAAAWLRQQNLQGYCILLKGSRAMHLETLVPNS